MPGVNAAFEHVEFGLDLAWDVFLVACTILFSCAMLADARFGRRFAVPGIAVAAALYVLNFVTFPTPPAAEGPVDLGSFGLSGEQPAGAMQASRAAAAVIAAAGLLGLAGRWGHQTRFWLPAALTWLGSGALAGFDGFWLMLNQLFAMFGTDGSEPGWSPSDRRW